ncbi:MAG: hypothetical protein JWO82_2238, partial [Akkermansiaceae bacterium]|nr:hypothetical protein [Akkermansiaceae bacterium]
MIFPASIRWRLQIWLGILLIGLLTAFGFTAWQSEKTQRLRRLDEELEKQVALLGAAIRGPEPGRGGPGGPRNGWRGGPGGPGRDYFHGPGGPSDSEKPPDWQPSGERGPQPPEFREEMLSEELKTFFNRSSSEGCYYVVWTGWSQRMKSSELAPDAVPMPARSDKTTQTRFRDREGVREVY